VTILSTTLETCRRLYNRLLDDRIENGTGFFDQKKSLVKAKELNKYLRAVHSQVLQDVVLRLDKAYRAFFTGLSGYPRFKKYGKCNSFTYPQTGFSLQGNSIRLSKIGRVKLKVHRPMIGEIKRVTVIRDIDLWFVAILTDGRDVSIQARDGRLGVDVGVRNIVTLSDGAMIEGPRFIGRSMEHIKSLQRTLSRKKKGSNNREKARIALAKGHRLVKRQREDFAHKLSDALTKDNNFIVFEDLKIGNMTKNHSLASAIMDASWGKLRRLTAYKAEKRGGRVILVNPYGTSQKCSGCGEMVPKELSEREHSCLRCGLDIDRDVNAARNILKLGQELAFAEKQPLLFQRRRISMFAPVKQEARVARCE
jgi:putative transposase